MLYGTLGDYRLPVPAFNAAYPPSEFNFPMELILSDEINMSVAAPAALVTYQDLMIPDLAILPEFLSASAACGFSPSVQTLAGALRVSAKAMPESVDRKIAKAVTTCANITAASAKVTEDIAAAVVQPNAATDEKLTGYTKTTDIKEVSESDIAALFAED